MPSTTAVGIDSSQDPMATAAQIVKRAAGIVARRGDVEPVSVDWTELLRPHIEGRAAEILARSELVLTTGVRDQMPPSEAIARGPGSASRREHQAAGHVDLRG